MAADPIPFSEVKNGLDHCKGSCPEYILREEMSYWPEPSSQRQRLFDRASELIGIDTNNSFARKLDQLNKDGHIGATERDRLAVKPPDRSNCSCDAVLRAPEATACAANERQFLLPHVWFPAS
jgi:hypothetical protein